MFVKKNVSFLLALCLILSSIILPIHATDTPNDFASKVVYENQVDFGDSSEDASTTLPDSVSVTLQFEHDFTCNHDTFENFDQVLEHREELKAYYSAKNASIITDLRLGDHIHMSYSCYGPFIEYKYETYEKFCISDYVKLERNNSEQLVKVYIKANYSSDDCATISGTEIEYPFTRALTDVGVPTTKVYDGTGIKIGILENGHPNNLSNLTGVPYYTNGETTSTHSFYVSSILGGTSGIASGASLYFSALSGSDEYQCYEWLINSGVHIINRSQGAAYGEYDSSAAYSDYLIQAAKVTIVCGAGNYDASHNSNNYIYTPSTGINVISVAASDINKAILGTSANALTEEWQGVLLKPTLTAPGGDFSGIANISDDIRLNATSFAAPFVTGIVALLMEEFPDLKLHPERVMALLTNSCTKVTGQSTIVDANAGFGLVNYTLAREYYSNGANFTLTTANASGTDAVYSMNVTVPARTSLFVIANILHNNVDTYTNGTVNFTSIKAVIKNNSSNATNEGTVVSNFSYVTLLNHTDSACTVTISIYAAESKALTYDENGALTYHFVTHNYTVSYETINYRYHYAYCGCGTVTQEQHNFTEEGANLRCVDCGYLMLLVR